MSRYYLILPLLIAVAIFAIFEQTSGVQTAGVLTANVQASGVQVANVQASAVQVAIVQTPGVRTENVQTVRAKAPRARASSTQRESVQTPNAQNEVVVVVSSRSPIKSLTPEQTTKIFLGKVVTFPNGMTAVPIDQPEGSAVRDEFYSRIVHKNSSQLTAYWAKVIFTGDGRPPKLLPDSMAVRKAVASDPNAIGYIETSAVNHSVRVVLQP